MSFTTENFTISIESTFYRRREENLQLLFPERKRDFYPRTKTILSPLFGGSLGGSFITIQTRQKLLPFLSQILSSLDDCRERIDPQKLPRIPRIQTVRAFDRSTRIRSTDRSPFNTKSSHGCDGCLDTISRIFRARNTSGTRNTPGDNDMTPAYVTFDGNMWRCLTDARKSLLYGPHQIHVHVQRDRLKRARSSLLRFHHSKWIRK